MPKVELHIHLEGSMRPGILFQLARKHGLELPASSEEDLVEWFRFRDFHHFVEIYLACSRCLTDPEDFQLLVDDFLAVQASQNIQYSEVHFTAGTHLFNGANGGELADAMWEAMQAGERRHGVRMRLIPDIVRDVPERADMTLEWAVSGMAKGVVALGLSGKEEHPTSGFRQHFEEARMAGLRCVAHAGEHGGPDSIRGVLADCGAERVGHGVAAVQDPELLSELVSASVPLEVSPTSNVCLGVADDIAAHPFDQLYRAGARLSVNSDDPPFFNTSLSLEYQLLQEAFDYRDDELAKLSLWALEDSFLESAEKEKLLEAFEVDFARLGVESPEGRNQDG